ncbi:MAG: 3-deoxy-D-manno-octulosonic acid transferase [Rhodobacteraceae bacterium]|nr:3-deoxy-D-manno-octulosonic acid transferase [Paracoccaceae bacterium]
MARSLSLAAYLAYARRNTATGSVPDRPRPDGTLIWCHATLPAHVDALLQLQDRLRMQRPDLVMLLTSHEQQPDTSATRALDVLWQPLPDDSVNAAEAFVTHWRPELCLWTGGDLYPALQSCADRHGIPLYLVDADEALLARPAWRWFPDLPRSLLRQFQRIKARNSDTARFLRRMGARDSRIEIAGPFIEGAVSLPYSETDREELAAILRGRPVWLGAHLQSGEVDTLLNAHKQVSRLSHRALLVVVPHDPGAAAGFSEALDTSGLRYITWSHGAMPEETTQVILADTDAEMGLWYRLAPISFMGSSLVPGAHGCDPNEPAAHGSAILYGPNIRNFLSSYSRFAEAGAARIVRDADTLAAAVNRLIPPDQSAAMAHAAWDVASQGAALTDRIAEMLHDALDTRQAGR